MFDEDEAATAAAPSPTDRPGHVAKSRPPRRSPPPAYRAVVAGWPDDWRERWGRRANELEEAGLAWRDAESQAFVEVWATVRKAPVASDPGQN